MEAGVNMSHVNVKNTYKSLEERINKFPQGAPPSKTLYSILSILFILIYLPFSPSSLVWPMEWLIVIGWYLIGFIFFMLGREKGINRDYNGGMNGSKENDK